MSQISSISSAVILGLSAEALYESYGSNSDVILVSKDRRVAWILFTIGVLFEGLSIVGISVSIDKVKDIREHISIDFDIEKATIKYAITF
jgi:hypothetical protein